MKSKTKDILTGLAGIVVGCGVVYGSEQIAEYLASGTYADGIQQIVTYASMKTRYGGYIAGAAIVTTSLLIGYLGISKSTPQEHKQ